MTIATLETSPPSFFRGIPSFLPSFLPVPTSLLFRPHFRVIDATRRRLEIVVACRIRWTIQRSKINPWTRKIPIYKKRGEDECGDGDDSPIRFLTFRSREAWYKESEREKKRSKGNEAKRNSNGEGWRCLQDGW